jgi:putative transposase
VHPKQLHCDCTPEKLQSLPAQSVDKTLKKTSLSDEQIVWAMAQHDAGTSIHNVCDRLNISVATFYNLRKRYAGFALAELKQLKELEAEKFRLAKLIETLSEDQVILQAICDLYLASNVETRACSKSRVREPDPMRST